MDQAAGGCPFWQLSSTADSLAAIGLSTADRQLDFQSAGDLLSTLNLLPAGDHGPAPSLLSAYDGLPTGLSTLCGSSACLVAILSEILCLAQLCHNGFYRTKSG